MHERSDARSRYRIEIELFDHARYQQQQQHSKEKRPFGLPPSLDTLLRRHASQVQLFPLKSFWKPLPVHRELFEASATPAGASASSSIDVTKKLAPWANTAFLPPQLVSQIDTSTQSNAVIDYRFGPLTIDWIDDPQPTRFVRTPTTSPQSIGMSLSPSGGYFAGASTESTSDWREASGSTDLLWGTVHLYREAGATESSGRDSNVKDDGTQLGMVSVPGNLSAANILAFIAPALESIAQVRVLKDSSPNRQIVLLRFRDAQSAAEFKRMYQGRTYYDSPESEVCHVVSISSIKLKTTSMPPFTFPWPASDESKNDIELPTCPVCLERLDANVTGLMQTSCTHTFHCSCLLKYGDSRCPICRATNFRTRRPTLSTPAAAACSTCKSNANLWMCTICGNVGCGRYQGGHAAKHYDESGHLYSLELETQRIWDYAGDMYVHRLIRSRTDGKVVELPSQFRDQAVAGGDGNDATGNDGKGGGPDRTDEASQDKIEAMGIEYANLMSSQLEAQRVYWEDEVARHKDERAVMKRRWEEAIAERARWRKEKSDLEKRIDELERAVSTQQATYEKRIEAIQKSAADDEARKKRDRAEANKAKRELEKQLDAEKAVTASLTQNLSHVRNEVAERDKETQAMKAQVAELTEQMRDVMFALTARDRIEAEGGAASELHGGSVSLPTPPPQPTPTTGSARRKNKKK